MSRLEAQGLLGELGIREEAINNELERSPTLSFSAASAAVDAKKDLRLFEDGMMAAYMSHVRRYARLYLKAVGDKDTIANIEDTVVMMFGRDTAETDRRKFMMTVYDFQLEQELGKKEAAKFREDDETKVTWVARAKSLYTDMYRYQLNDKPYDWFLEKRAELKSEAEKAEAAAAAFKERAHCLVAIAANLRAAGDVDAYSVNPYTSDVMTRIKRACLKNPDVDPDVLGELATAKWKEERGEG